MWLFANSFRRFLVCVSHVSRMCLVCISKTRPPNRTPLNMPYAFAGFYEEAILRPDILVTDFVSYITHEAMKAIEGADWAQYYPTFVRNLATGVLQRASGVFCQCCVRAVCRRISIYEII